MTTQPDPEPPPITLVELQRLIKLAGMLGSSHDGEALAAARKVGQWVREHGTDWETLLTPPADNPVVAVGVGDPASWPAPPPPPPTPPPAPVPPSGNLGSWQAVCAALLAHYPIVLRNVGAPRSDEQDFVSGLLRKGWSALTPAQEKWLRDIAARAGLSW